MPGFIWVVVLQHGQFIRNHLQRHDGTKRGERAIRRNDDGIVAQPIRQLLVVRDHDQLGPSRLHLLARGAHVVRVHVVEDEHDDGRGPLFAFLVLDHGIDDADEGQATPLSCRHSASS